MKNNFLLRLIIIFTLLFGSLLFYSLHVQPSEIRKSCHKDVSVSSEILTSKAEREFLNILEINMVEREKYNHYYAECLHSHGLSE